jgi:hypothetical protein
MIWTVGQLEAGGEKSYRPSPYRTTAAAEDIAGLRHHPIVGVSGRANVVEEAVPCPANQVIIISSQSLGRSILRRRDLRMTRIGLKCGHSGPKMEEATVCSPAVRRCGASAWGAPLILVSLPCAPFRS